MVVWKSTHEPCLFRNIARDVGFSLQCKVDYSPEDIRILGLLDFHSDRKKSLRLFRKEIPDMHVVRIAEFGDHYSYIFCKIPTQISRTSGTSFLVEAISQYVVSTWDSCEVLELNGRHEIWQVDGLSEYPSEREIERYNMNQTTCEQKCLIYKLGELSGRLKETELRIFGKAVKSGFLRYPIYDKQFYKDLAEECNTDPLLLVTMLQNCTFKLRDLLWPIEHRRKDFMYPIKRTL